MLGLILVMWTSADAQDATAPAEGADQQFGTDFRMEADEQPPDLWYEERERLWQDVRAQDFTLQLAQDGWTRLDDPYFGTRPPTRSKFAYGAGISATYDSNFFLSESDEVDELVTRITPWLTYRSDPDGTAYCSFDFRYAPIFNVYLENRDLDDLDHNASASFRFQGAKTLIELFANYAEVSSSDRFSGGFIEGSILNYGIRASYQVAPRTSLYGSWAAASSDYDSGGNTGSDVYTLQFGANWEATSHLSFGPAIRHTTTESDNIGTREAWAILGQVRYRAGDRVNLAASLGLEFADESEGGSSNDISLTGDLSASYAINDRWTWISAIQYATVPSPNSASLIDNFMISTVLSHDLARGTVEGGLTFSSAEYESFGPADLDQGNDDYWSVFLRYRRPIFAERVMFESALRYSKNDGQTDWSQIQLSAGLTTEF